MEQRTLDAMAAFIRRVAAQLAAPSEPPVAGGTVWAPTSTPSPSVTVETAPESAPQLLGTDPDWEEAERALETGDVHEATVVGWNRGGLLVHWRSLQGFLPASQLQRMIRYTTDAERDAAFAGRVGEVLQLKVIEVDRTRKRLVFSERALQWAGSDSQCLWESLQAGQVRRGRVRNLCDFGAFVDLGGIDGLIHISELAWSHVRHPADTLEMGQEIDVYVMAVEPERKRVALSLKKLTPDPWETVEERYHVGQLVQGVVTNILNFGAFACIEDGVEGLIHISELGESSLSHPRDLVAPGDPVAVRIIGIDATSRRLALSARLAHQTDEGPAQAGE